MTCNISAAVAAAFFSFGRTLFWEDDMEWYQRLKTRVRLLIAFACVWAFTLIVSLVGILSFNRISRADARLYTVGVETLGIMAELREEFASCPLHIRDMVIEKDPDGVNKALWRFNKSKKNVMDNLEQIDTLFKGYPEKTKVLADVATALNYYWERADVCIGHCQADRKPEALQYMKTQAYPTFQAAQKAMYAMQDHVKNDAVDQKMANGRTIKSVKTTMVACTLLAILVSVLFSNTMANFIAHNPHTMTIKIPHKATEHEAAAAVHAAIRSAEGGAVTDVAMPFVSVLRLCSKFFMACLVIAVPVYLVYLVVNSIFGFARGSAF